MKVCAVHSLFIPWDCSFNYFHHMWWWGINLEQFGNISKMKVFVPSAAWQYTFVIECVIFVENVALCEMFIYRIICLLLMYTLCTLCVTRTIFEWIGIYFIIQLMSQKYFVNKLNHLRSFFRFIFFTVLYNVAHSDGI